jgi:hypothetical protein
MKIFIPIIIALLSLILSAVSVFSGNDDLVSTFRISSTTTITFCLLFYPIYFIFYLVKRDWRIIKRFMMSLVVISGIFIICLLIPSSRGIVSNSALDLLSSPGNEITRSLEDLVFSMIDNPEVSWADLINRKPGLTGRRMDSILFDDQSVLALVYIKKSDLDKEKDYFLLLRINKKGSVIKEQIISDRYSSWELEKYSSDQFYFYLPPSEVSTVFDNDERIGEISFSPLRESGSINIIELADDQVIYSLFEPSRKTNYRGDYSIQSFDIKDQTNQVLYQYPKGESPELPLVRKVIFLKEKNILVINQSESLDYFTDDQYRDNFCIDDSEFKVKVVDVDYQKRSETFWLLVSQRGNSGWRNYSYTLYQCSLDGDVLQSFDYKLGGEISNKDISFRTKIKLINENELMLVSDVKIIKTNLTGDIDDNFKEISFEYSEESQVFDDGRVYFPRIGKLYNSQGELIIDYLKSNF